MTTIVKISALLFGSALLMFGGGLQGLLLAVRGAEEGFSLLALGLIGTGWSAGFIAGSLFVAALVRRVGHIRTFSVMAALGTITILLNLLWINDVGWIVMRALSGFCFAGAAMVVESWLNEVSDNPNRGTIFSVYTSVNLVASTIGQLAISVTGVAGFVPFVVGAIAFICAVLPPALTTSPQPRPLSTAKLDIPLLIRTSPVAAVASFCVGMANGAFGTLAPVYGYAQGLDPANIAYLFASAAALGAIAQIPAGRLSDLIDRRLVLIGLASLGTVAGAVVIFINPGAGWLLFVLFALYGLAANPIYAVAVAHANDFARDGDFAGVAGGMLLIFGIGLALGPVLASIVMDLFGPVGLFSVTAVFHALLAAFAFLRMRVRTAPEPVHRAPFQPVSTPVTPEEVALDPRSDVEPQPEPEPEPAAPIALPGR